MSADSENGGTLRPTTAEDVELQDDSVPQAAILYLLQEATKLVTPAKEEWRLGSRSCCTEQSIPCSSGPTARPSPPSSPPVEKSGLDSRRNYSGCFSVLQSQRGNSPWEVMSLINLQCERLLYRSGEEGEDDGRRSVATTPASNRALFHGEFEALGHDGGLDALKQIDAAEEPRNIKDTVREAEGWGSPLRNHKASDEGLLTLLCDKSAVSTGPVLVEIPPFEEGEPLNSARDKVEKQDSGGTEFPNHDVVKLHHHEDDANAEGLEGKQMVAPCLMDAKNWGELGQCGTETESLSLPTGVLQEKGCKQEVSLVKHGELIGSDDVFASVPLANLADSNVKMDYNSNLILASGPPQNVAGSPISFHELTGKLQPGNRGQDLAEETCAPFHNLCENVNAQPPGAMTATLGLNPKWRGRTPRKQRHPTRSADLCDPDFRGVSFRIRTELNDNRDQCRLLITSKYSAEFWKSGRKARGSRTRSIINSLKSSSSEEETDAAGLAKNKMCASCSTKTTPLWRDAEDGTPLCNACGIRYKKYRVRCHQCWLIPRKEGNSNSRCFRCGDALSSASSNRRQTKDPAASLVV